MRPLVAFSGAIYFAFAPVIWFSGFHAPWSFGIGGVFAAIIVLLGKLTPRGAIVRAFRGILVAWVGLVAMTAIMATPILVAPGLAAVVAMATAGHPRVLPRWL